MTKKEYLVVRKKSTALAHEIIDSTSNNRERLLYASKLLGFLNGETVVFEDDNEMDILMNFVLYERGKYGKRLIDAFYNIQDELDEMGEEILDGMIDSFSSLFEVLEIDKNNHLLVLTDLLEKERTIYKLMDIGISQSFYVGAIIHTRLIPIRDINMTSGVSFPFDTVHKNRILRDLTFSSFTNRRKGKKLNSTDLYILAHKKCKIYGRKVDKE